MLKSTISAELNNENDILAGMRLNIRFYPTPGSKAFLVLSRSKQLQALDYFEKENARIGRLELLYLTSV